MATKKCKVTTKETPYETQILYKYGREIICYISCGENKYIVCNGKHSDRSCLCWIFDNLDDAKKDAQELFDSHLSFLAQIKGLVKSVH